MDNLLHDQMLESPAERQARLVWEDEMIDQSLTSVETEGVVPFAAVKAWVASWDTDHELPPPRPVRPS